MATLETAPDWLEWERRPPLEGQASGRGTFVTLHTVYVQYRASSVKISHLSHHWFSIQGPLQLIMCINFESMLLVV